MATSCEEGPFESDEGEDLALVSRLSSAHGMATEGD